MDGISIHAPREGSDGRVKYHQMEVVVISIHAPREGSDLGIYHLFADGELFQSTLPVRGATILRCPP